MLEKGIIIAPSFTIHDGGCRIHGVSPLSLRQSLLFWDKIDVPANNAVYIGLDPDMQFLSDAGVLQQTLISVPQFSGNLAYRIIADQLAALRINDAREPGEWSISQCSNALLMPLVAGDLRDVVE